MNKSLSIAATATVLVFSTSSYANRSFDIAAGYGNQYGPNVGAQLSLASEFDRYYVSLGFGSGGWGYQRAIDEDTKHSLGINQSVYSHFNLDKNDCYSLLTYNYHPDGFKSEGITLGFAIGEHRQKQYDRDGDLESEKKGPTLTLSIGYKF